MSDRKQFSDVTKNYLTQYFAVLDEMMERMTHVALTDSISDRFIAQILPHHMAAIEFSRNLLRFTTMLPLQTLAQQIIEARTSAIAALSAMRAGGCETVNTEQELRLYDQQVQQITRAMFDAMQSHCSENDLNLDYIREMLPHQFGAIELLENALRFSLCEELAPILRSNLTTVRKEICEMTRLLQCT